MSSSEREPRLPWLLSLTGAEGVYSHTPLGVILLLQLVGPFNSWVLLCTVSAESVLTREHGSAGLVDLSMQLAPTLVKQPTDSQLMILGFFTSVDASCMDRSTSPAVGCQLSVCSQLTCGRVVSGGRVQVEHGAGCSQGHDVSAQQ